MAASSLEDPRWPPRADCLFYPKINSKPPLLFGDRPPFFRRAGWCWCDRQEDHCRHIRRVGSSRRRSFLWQRLLEGRPLRCLRRPLGGQVSGQSQTVQESPGSGECRASSRDARGLRPSEALTQRADKTISLSPSVCVTGVLCHRGGPSSVHLLVHLRFLRENRDRAAPHRQQELWSAARRHCQVNAVDCGDFFFFFFVITASSKSVSRQTFLFLENVDNLCESCRSCCFLLPLCVLLDFTTRGRQSWTFSICAHSGFNAGMCADGKPISKNDNRNYIIFRI